MKSYFSSQIILTKNGIERLLDFASDMDGLYQSHDCDFELFDWIWTFGNLFEMFDREGSIVSQVLELGLI